MSKNRIAGAAIAVGVLIFIAGLIYWKLHRPAPEVMSREDELRMLEEGSQPITVTPEERGKELEMLGKPQPKQEPMPSAEDRTAELEALSQ